ncbi:MAG: HAD family hydrolase [Alphaproteobacteria bacterium]|nr:HAD family hydrolase [Alphaproteobacteria bacterium]
MHEIGLAMIIKNIFWDVDGVLANLNYAYYNFLTKHPKYAPDYAALRWEDLPKVLPIAEKYGALELKTHPEKGVEMDYDFCHSPEFFCNRPLYPNVIKVLKELHQLGYRQFTMSATFDVETKKRFLNNLLAEVTDFLTIECVQHGKFMHDSAKEDMLKSCFEKYGLKPEETVLVDDRIYNQYATINAGAHPVRMRCEFTSDLPEELSFIPEVKNMEEFKSWLLTNTTMA